MKKIFLFIVLALGVCSPVFTQLAIVKDSDGFTNIRVGPSKDSAVADTLVAGRLVYCFDQEEGGQGWYPVDYNKDGEMHTGYIHISRIVFLERMELFTERTKDESEIELRYDSISIIMKAGQANIKGRKLAHDSTAGVHFIATIDGRHIYGTDGEIPLREYKSIVLKNGSRTFPFSKKLFDNFFEPNLDGYTSASIDKSTGLIYLVAYNSDGAGGYIVVWVLRDNKVINTEIFYGF
jgi:hypothetical protein